MVLSKIIGTGKYLPDKILTNFDLEKMVDTSDKWIKERSGISERRIANDKELCSYIGTMAVKKALKDAKLEAEDIDFLICATNSPDMIFPATAMRILNNLDVSTIPGMDVQSGCTSFAYSMDLADSLLKNGNRYKNIVVVGTERLSKLIDWEDRNTCVLFGDGAGACVLSANKENESGIVTSFLGGDSTKTHAIELKAGMSLSPASEETVKNREHFVKMEGQDVYKFAIKIIPQCIKKVLKQANLTLDDIKLIIPHQANTRIVETAAKFLKLSMDKFFINIDKYGNTSAASIPIALNEAIENGQLERGDYFITVGFGAGLTYGANLIKY